MGASTRCCTMPMPPTTHPKNKAVSINAKAAQLLREAATLLERQAENPFRINAYRRAAASVEGLETSLLAMVDQGGVEALQLIPGVGESIASSLAEILATGRWSYIDRLRGSTSPEALFCTVPGIGPALARRLHEQLHVETLEQLAQALGETPSERVAGLGARRRESLSQAIAKLIRRTRPLRAEDEPDVDMILAVDEAYRQKALAGVLPRIAPLRFNPSGAAWLPIMHTTRNGWHFTVLYSNTARAHELGKTRDWVVVYFHSTGGTSSQRTVVTEGLGPLAGARVVRGREGECLRRRQNEAPADPPLNGTEH